MGFRKEGWFFILPPIIVAIWWHQRSLPTIYNPWLYFSVITLPSILGIALLASFFRDPQRNRPEKYNTKCDVLSPADGKLVAYEEEQGKLAFFIEMHLDNVHVNRCPRDATVIQIERIPGKHFMIHYFKKTKANKSKAVKKNAHAIITLKDDQGQQFKCFLICGAFFRRARPLVHVGETIQAGDRLGMILFGSTVKVLLDSLDYSLKVNIGDTVRAGETIICSKGK